MSLKTNDIAFFVAIYSEFQKNSNVNSAFQH